MAQRVVLAVAVLAVAGYALYVALGPGPADRLEVRDRYLLVEAAGPPGWADAGRCTVRWGGRDVPLPVVFRVRGPGPGPDLGAEGPPPGLVVGGRRVPVSAAPGVAVEARNTGAVAVIGGGHGRSGAAAVSVATAVAVSPPDWPGEPGPQRAAGATGAAAGRLERRVRELIDAGQVIDVAADE
jgi:hypothetical protein